MTGRRGETFKGPVDGQLIQAAAGAALGVVGRHLRRSRLGVHLRSVAHALDARTAGDPMSTLGARAKGPISPQ